MVEKGTNLSRRTLLTRGGAFATGLAIAGTAERYHLLDPEQIREINQKVIKIFCK